MVKESKETERRNKKCYIYIMKRAKNTKSGHFMVNDDIAIVSISCWTSVCTEDWIKYIETRLGYLSNET